MKSVEETLIAAAEPIVERAAEMFDISVAAVRQKGRGPHRVVSARCLISRTLHDRGYSKVLISKIIGIADAGICRYVEHVHDRMYNREEYYRECYNTLKRELEEEQR